MNGWMTTAAVLAMSMLFAAQAVAVEPKAEPVDPEQIPASRYLRVQDGQLWAEGERQRYWGTTGIHFARSNIEPGDSPEVRSQKVEQARASTRILLDRFEDLGFNALRTGVGFYDADASFEPGDGSLMDDVNHFVALAGERGFRIWINAFNRIGEVTPDDVDILDEPETAESWRAAIEEAGGAMNLRNNPARIWDPRLEALAIQRMQAIANHYNPYTGLRWADDPTFVVWELSNEEWWISRMLTGSWQQLPAYFRNQLVARWNQFLLEKYGNEAALVQAWEGLLEGESLSQGTVLFLPMTGATSAEVAINDAGAHAAEALRTLAQEYGPDDFVEQRGRDVLEFLTKLIITHKQAEADAVKPLGRSLSTSPMIYDTGIGYRIQEQYLHQQADAVAHDAYVNGVGADRWDQVEQAEDELGRMLAELSARAVEPNDGRWINWLRKPPGIAEGVPWLEHNRTPNMPYFVYETNIQQPAKYRADFPLRIGALAAIQDWDFVVWHYFGDGSMNELATTERPFDKPMDITTGWHPQGYHFTYDEVQAAMMRAAAIMFRHQHFEPAQHPTVYLYGRDTLYDPDSMPYGRSYGQRGMNMLGTVYEHGVRLWIDPAMQADAVIGPEVTYEQRWTHNPFQPTQQIRFDREKGYLWQDAPAAVAFTGMMAEVGDTLAFDNGVTLEEVSIHNPEGIYEPIDEDEKYIAFALSSLDDRPLAEAERISLSLVSTSFNTGFRLGEGDEQPTVRGELPVLVARVAGTVHSDAIDGMRYTLYDWHMEPIGEGVVEGAALHIPNDQPVFVIELTRE
ncbi:MAG: hypothetical protein WD151_06835 [Phycisphaeraceae bacterium]